MLSHPPCCYEQKCPKLFHWPDDISVFSPALLLHLLLPCPELKGHTHCCNFSFSPQGLWWLSSHKDHVMIFENKQKQITVQASWSLILIEAALTKECVRWKQLSLFMRISTTSNTNWSLSASCSSVSCMRSVTAHAMLDLMEYREKCVHLLADAPALDINSENAQCTFIYCSYTHQCQAVPCGGKLCVSNRFTANWLDIFKKEAGRQLPTGVISKQHSVVDLEFKVHAGTCSASGGEVHEN